MSPAVSTKTKVQWELSVSDRKLDLNKTVCAQCNQTLLSIVPDMELLCFVLIQVDFDFMVSIVFVFVCRG